MSTSSPAPRTTRWTSYTNGNYSEAAEGPRDAPCLLEISEWMRSIVMSASVCVFICPQAYLWNHTRAIIAKFFVHVAYGRGSVLLRHADDRPHQLSAGRGDGSAQRGRSVIYDCLVNSAVSSTATTRPGQLSLLPSVGREMSTSQSAVMLCG